jgi:hypothetical protein
MSLAVSAAVSELLIDAALGAREEVRRSGAFAQPDERRPLGDLL